VNASLSAEPMSQPRVSILGVGVSAVTMTQAVEAIDAWIAQRRQHYVCVTGVHGLMESRRDSLLRQVYRGAGLVTADGMPLVWLSRRRGFRHAERVYGPDLMLRVCGQSLAKGYRHYFYGATPAVTAELERRLCQRFPGLNVVGACSPPFRPLTAQEDGQIVEEINATAPDVVWVGLSTPKQEHWMAAHIGQISAPALIGVGAAFDFHAGTKRQAPCWMQRMGLEWLFRLASEPKRLWRRYLINNPRFIGLVLSQELGWQRDPVG